MALSSERDINLWARCLLLEAAQAGLPSRGELALCRVKPVLLAWPKPLTGAYTLHLLLAYSCLICSAIVISCSPEASPWSIVNLNRSRKLK